jgi:hypothetical protein
VFCLLHLTPLHFYAPFWRLSCVFPVVVPLLSFTIVIEGGLIVCFVIVIFNSHIISLRGSVCITTLNDRRPYRLDPTNRGFESKRISDFHVTEIYLSKKGCVKIFFSFFDHHKGNILYVSIEWPYSVMNENILKCRVIQIPSGRLHEDVKRNVSIKFR